MGHVSIGTHGIGAELRHLVDDFVERIRGEGHTAEVTHSGEPEAGSVEASEPAAAAGETPGQAEPEPEA